MLVEEFQSKVTRRQNCYYWMDYSALEEKAMALLTPPPSGRPAGEHTHVPVFLRHCDLNSGPVPKAWQRQRQRTLILLSASDGGLVEAHFTWPAGPAHLGEGGQSGHWHHGVEFTGTHKFLHHENMAVHNNLSWFSFFSVGFFQKPHLEATKALSSLHIKKMLWSTPVIKTISPTHYQ